MVLDVSDGSFVSPIEILWEILGGENGCLLSVRRQAQRLEAQELAAELGRSEIGEFGDAVDGGGVELGVQPRSAEVGLEDAEATVVLLLGRVLLPELRLEAREVVLRVQQVVLLLLRRFADGIRHHLTDQDVVGGAGHGGEEEEEEGQEEGVASHMGKSKGGMDWRGWKWRKFNWDTVNEIWTRIMASFSTTWE